LSVAFVLKGYPRLSETFIAQEIAALERRGLDIRIVSLRRPTDARRHPVHEEIRAPILYLPEYLHLEPSRVFRAWLSQRKKPGYRAAKKLWLRDLRRDPTPNRIRRFGQALVLAAELPPDVTHLHAHFLHTPASVTRYTAKLLGLPWSGSAHAKDVWTTPEWEKREKLADCEWLVTCTEVNRVHLAHLAPPGKVELVYHGLDLSRFPKKNPSAKSGEPAIVLSVCRLVEKKGVDVLLEALARLPREAQWRFVHVGGGPLAKALRGKAAELGIAGRAEWRGPLAQRELLEIYGSSDIFALASRVADDGDRDGLPNVLMEAASQGLPCVATRVSAIGELVRDGVSGLLVPENDPAALAAALAALIADPARRRALGEAGEARVRAHFALEQNLEPLARKFAAGGEAGAGGAHAHRVLRTA
jgi:glycosyltransferase involved in cell wall biosynthesis